MDSPSDMVTRDEVLNIGVGNLTLAVKKGRAVVDSVFTEGLCDFHS